MDLFHHIFMGCTNIMGHEPLKIHGKFMYYAYMIIPLNSHDYFHGNFMAFGLVVKGHVGLTYTNSYITASSSFTK